MSFGSDPFTSEDRDPLNFEGYDPLISLVNRKKIDPKALQKLNKKKYAAWVLYDVANTFYASGILSFISLAWILVLGQKNGYSYGDATALYSVVIAIASVFMAIMLPILGSMSDVTQQRKNYVVFFSVVSIVSTWLFIILDSFFWVLLVFSISMITYQWAQVFYDSMLPGIVPPGKEAKLSSIAITIGYLGGAMITAYAWFLSQSHDAPNADPDKLDDAGNLIPIQLGYSEQMAYAVIVGFTLLAIPIFFVREQNWDEINALVFLNEMDEWQAIYSAFADSVDEDITGSSLYLSPKSMWKIAKEALHELWESFRDIRYNNQAMFYYIVAYFIIADLANLMALINIVFLRDSVGLSEDGIFFIIMLSGVSLLILTPIIGVICDKYGAKTGYKFVGILWFLALITMILQNFILPSWTIYIAALAFGPALSGVWVAQRQMVLELVPDDSQIGKYFGLTKFSGKLSSAIGPLIFATTLKFSERVYANDPNQIQIAYRWSITSLTIFLAVGFYILMKYVPNKSVEFKKRKKRIAEVLDASETLAGQHPNIP